MTSPQKAYETASWKEILKVLQKAGSDSLKLMDAVDNPVLDQALLQSTRDFLRKDYPGWLEQDGQDLYELIAGLARKVVPLKDTHVEASRAIIHEFLLSTDSQSSDAYKANNVEFLRKIVFCLEEPVNTDTSLSDGEFRMLERLVNAFSDRLKFNPNREDLAVREDLLLVAFRKQQIDSGSIPRTLEKVSKFAGMSSEKTDFYDVNLGRERKTRYYKFDPEFEKFLDDLGLVEHGFNEQNQPVRYLSSEIPVEYLYGFIQGWRSVNLEPDILGEYLINGICNVLAYTILMALPEGKLTAQEQVQQSAALLSDEVCHPLIIALSQAVAFVIYGDNWYRAIWTSPKKSKYHRSVRYVIVGNVIRIQQGVILLNNNVMTNYVRNYVVRVGGASV